MTSEEEQEVVVMVTGFDDRITTRFERVFFVVAIVIALMFFGSVAYAIISGGGLR